MKKITLFLFISFLYTLGVFAQPANDDCSGAVSSMTTLTVGSPGVCSYTVVNLVNANDSGYVDASCSSDGWEDLWYVLTMPASGAVRVETSRISSTNDTAMSAYKGSDCSSLELIGCNDDIFNGAGESLYSRIEIFEPQNTTIYIRVWDIEGNTGSFNLCASEIVLVTNDDCDSPTPLPTDSNDVLASNSATDSTNNTDFGSCNSTYNGGDVWFTVETPASGYFSVETSADDGSITDTAMAIYSGSCPDGLTLITCHDDIDASSENRFSLIELSGQTPGDIFYVRVWSVFDEEKGTFNIRAYDPTLGIEDVIEQTFKVFPNPARDIVNLKLGHASNNKIMVSLYNIQGKLVHHAPKTLNNQSVQLDISNLSTGMYFLKVNDGVREATKKLIVN